MKPLRTPSALIAAVLWCALAHAQALAQNSPQPTPAATPASTPQTSAAPKLSEAETQLVRASKEAILATGISEPYFNAHFKLAQVFNSMSDRRVVWRFKTGEHEATLVDSVGFHMDAKGRPVYTHTVGQTLASAHDIRRTITRRQAERIMKSCIGEFEDNGVVYQATGRPPRAALVFMALSLPKPEAPVTAPTTSAAQAPAPPASTPVEQSSQADIVKPGGKKKPFLLTGGVNLETGRCTKGLAQVGSPLPTRPETRSRTRQ